MTKRRTDKQEKRMAEKRNRKESAMKHAGKKSKYARKKEWLNSNQWSPVNDDCPTGRSSRRCFGFEVPDPKPWK